MYKDVSELDKIGLYDVKYEGNNAGTVYSVNTVADTYDDIVKKMTVASENEFGVRKTAGGRNFQSFWVDGATVNIGKDRLDDVTISIAGLPIVKSTGMARLNLLLT